MRLISNLAGSATRVVSLEQMLPSNGFPFVSVSRVLREKYNFQTTSISQKAQQLGVIVPAFQTGEINYRGLSSPIISLELAPSEMTAVCARTDIADHVLDDVIGELCGSQFAFKKPEKIDQTTYSSTLVVEAGFSLIESLGKWADVFALLQRKLTGAQFEPTLLGIKFIGKVGELYFDDPTHSFTFEKRLTNVTANWQFTTAPFKSDEHYALLEEMERILIVE